MNILEGKAQKIGLEFGARYSKHHLLDQVKFRGIKVGPAAEWMFRHESFFVCQRQEKRTLVIMKPRDLGFDGPYARRDIQSRLFTGEGNILHPCYFPETAARLCLKWHDDMSAVAAGRYVVSTEGGFHLSGLNSFTESEAHQYGMFEITVSAEQTISVNGIFHRDLTISDVWLSPDDFLIVEERPKAASK